VKKIIVIRHATATARGPADQDFERSLRKKGRKESRVMACWYKGVEEVPDLILSSSAKRADETARIFAKGIGYPVKKINRSRRLYELAEPSALLEIIGALDDQCNSVMVFGHDPLFTKFAHFLVKDFVADLPKCSVLVIGFDRKHWRTIRAGDGRCLVYEDPEGLGGKERRAKEARRELAARIEKGIHEALADFGIGGAKRTGKSIGRASAKLARTFASRIGEEATEAVEKVGETEASSKEKNS
jgi:phosphohistidine phosphatase